MGQPVSEEKAPWGIISVKVLHHTWGKGRTWEWDWL